MSIGISTCIDWRSSSGRENRTRPNHGIRHTLSPLLLPFHLGWTCEQATAVPNSILPRRIWHRTHHCTVEYCTILPAYAPVWGWQGSNAAQYMCYGWILPGRSYIATTKPSMKELLDKCDCSMHNKRVVAKAQIYQRPLHLEHFDTFH